jgi:hypothetical protein
MPGKYFLTPLYMGKFLLRKGDRGDNNLREPGKEAAANKFNFTFPN